MVLRVLYCLCSGEHRGCLSWRGGRGFCTKGLIQKRERVTVMRGLFTGGNMYKC